jgi:hypothetical protein
MCATSAGGPRTTTLKKRAHSTHRHQRTRNATQPSPRSPSPLHTLVRTWMAQWWYRRGGVWSVAAQDVIAKAGPRARL